MTSIKYLLHQISDPQLSTDERAILRCQLAKQLEEAGNYEAACEAMGDLWLGVGKLPNLSQLDQLTMAEVLLRIGTLTGWIGSTKQIKDAQETAKNLLSESITIFDALPDVKKVAEAQTEIGYCYWREGAIDEARMMLSEALTNLDDRDGDMKGVALLRSASVEKVANRLNDALSILTKASPLFAASNNHTLKGRFHNEFATVLKNLGITENRADYIDRALIEFAAAGFHFEQAGHARYQACVENNLAMLFLQVDGLTQAHEHLDRAQALFTRLDDIVHLAQVEETRARVMLAEGAIARAEKIARCAVRMLEQGGEHSLLAEALSTHGIALAQLNHKDEGRATFERAIQIAEEAGDRDSAGVAALCLVEQLAEHLSDDDLCVILDRARALLEHTQNTSLRNRLTDCAYHALSRFQAFRPDWTTFSLRQTLLRQEARFIKMAIEEVGGVISRAARLLGLKGHQSLQFILKGRHRELYESMAPVFAQKERPLTDEHVSRHLDKAPHN
jgi:tetratricopeptide (TPR) repeat protein